MTLHLHDYGHTGVGPGGAPINYAEVSRLLLGEPALHPRPHDFHAIVDAAESEPLRGVARTGDTLVCTVGPYAHLYHYWRERSGLDFRIIRDARTTAWSPYLLQEWLVAPLVRPGDIVVFPSEFARAFYREAFTHVTQANSRVLYPLAEHLPEIGLRRPSGTLRIGCLGRMAVDKNIVDAMAVVARVRRTQAAELHLAGPFEPPSRQVGSPSALARAARQAGLPADAVTYHGDLPHGQVWRFYSGIDVLFFPGVSTNESFGRVIAEAGHAGVPVIATDYAAAPELLPRPNLVQVHYRAVRQARLSTAFSLGSPDLEQAAAALASNPRVVDVISDPRYAKATFLRMVSGDEDSEPGPVELSPGVRRFLDGTHLDGLERLSHSQAIDRCAAQLRLMRLLSHRGIRSRLRSALCLAPLVRGDPMVMRVARESLCGKLPRGVLRNVVAHGRFLGFDPRLTLNEATSP